MHIYIYFFSQELIDKKNYENRCEDSLKVISQSNQGNKMD